jgi:LysM repeat protein
MAAGVLALFVTAANAQGTCGDRVRVLEGDTLSRIAARCGVTEARILDLNPKIAGSNDLRPGMTLDLAAPSASEAAEKAREATKSVIDRIQSYAVEASKTLESAAEKVTSSVREFLERNPNLHQTVRKLGQRLNIPGMEKAEPLLSMSVRQGAPGAPVTLSAIGLPGNQRITIAGGVPGGEYQILETARTTTDGTLQVTVEIPEWADPERDFMFVMANPELSVAARSEVLDVVATTGRAAPPK